MPATCPKCRYARKENETAPDWQCPACGVAYVKAEQALRADRPAPQRITPAETRTIPWRAVGVLLLIAIVAWAAGKNSRGTRDAGDKAARLVSANANFGGEQAEERLRALAATVKPGDVVIYSAVWCGACAQAKSWLRGYGFAFSECDVEAEPRCAREFEGYGVDGVPLLIVRGQQMRTGFSSEEFLKLIDT